MSARSVFLAILISLLVLFAYHLIGPHGDFRQYLLQQAARSTTIALLALAAAVLISCGQIDLSSAACLNLFGIIAISACNSWPSPAAAYVSTLGAAILAASLYGAYGFITARFSSVASLMITLAVSLAITGLNHFILNALQGSGPLVPLLNPERLNRFKSLGPDQVGVILPSPFLHGLLLVATLVVALVWRFYSVESLRHLSLGENQRAASRVGVDRGQVLRFAFLIAGALVFMSWMNEFFAVRQGSWNIDSARGYELLAISAAVIGGTRIQGGRLDPLSVVLAAGFVQLALGITHLTSMPSEASYLFTGFALAVVCYIDGKRSQVDATA